MIIATFGQSNTNGRDVSNGYSITDTSAIQYFTSASVFSQLVDPSGNESNSGASYRPYLGNKLYKHYVENIQFITYALGGHGFENWVNDVDNVKTSAINLINQSGQNIDQIVWFLGEQEIVDNVSYDQVYVYIDTLMNQIKLSLGQNIIMNFILPFVESPYDSTNVRNAITNYCATNNNSYIVGDAQTKTRINGDNAHLDRLGQDDLGYEIACNILNRNNITYKIGNYDIDDIVIGLFPENDISSQNYTSGYAITYIGEDGNNQNVGILSGFGTNYGFINKQYLFDGGDCNINFGDVVKLNSVDRFSIELIVKPNTLSATEYFFRKQATTSSRYSITMNGGWLYFYINSTYFRMATSAYLSTENDTHIL